MPGGARASLKRRAVSLTAPVGDGIDLATDTMCIRNECSPVGAPLQVLGTDWRPGSPVARDSVAALPPTAAPPFAFRYPSVALAEHDLEQLPRPISPVPRPRRRRPVPDFAWAEHPYALKAPRRSQATCEQSEHEPFEAVGFAHDQPGEPEAVQHALDDECSADDNVLATRLHRAKFLPLPHRQ